MIVAKYLLIDKNIFKESMKLGFDIFTASDLNKDANSSHKCNTYAF